MYSKTCLKRPLKHWSVHVILAIIIYSAVQSYCNIPHYNIYLYTVKPVLSSHPKIDKTKILVTNGSLMKVESIAECSFWSILQYFWPALSYYFVLKTIFWSSFLVAA